MPIEVDWLKILMPIEVDEEMCEADKGSEWVGGVTQKFTSPAVTMIGSFEF